VANPKSRKYGPSPYLIDRHWIDFALAHLNPLWSVTAGRTRVLDVRRASPDISTFVLQPSRAGGPFVPDSFAPLRVRSRPRSRAAHALAA
jgi:hypothetical protein